jgi:ubiquinone/menaquinone biosynthesis C-methylase UbiE
MTTTEIARPRFARMYLRSAASAEQRGASDHRRRLLEGLRGTVVEIGAGHGLNFPHYPSEVTEVIAIEPEPTLRGEAETAAESANVPIRVLAGVADALPLTDGSADAAVASLVLCSVPAHPRQGPPRLNQANCAPGLDRRGCKCELTVRDDLPKRRLDGAR